MKANVFTTKLLDIFLVDRNNLFIVLDYVSSDLKKMLT